MDESYVYDNQNTQQEHREWSRARYARTLVTDSPRAAKTSTQSGDTRSSRPGAANTSSLRRPYSSTLLALDVWFEVVA